MFKFFEETLQANWRRTNLSREIKSPESNEMLQVSLRHLWPKDEELLHSTNVAIC